MKTDYMEVVQQFSFGFRCPNNVLDFYEVIKYVALHAADLGVDPARLAIAGESGGGYICAGAMVQLARQEEGHLVKLAVPIESDLRVWRGVSFREQNPFSGCSPS